jgi:hypothetical protein
MIETQVPAPRRRVSRRTMAIVSLAVVAAGGTLLTTATAGAATSTTIKITAVGPHRVTALTANQVITVTGKGFDEAGITSVAVAGCTAPSYIVASPTSLLIKTDATCVAAASAAITITDTSSNTAVSVPGATGGAQALAFVAAPTIADTTTSFHPVTTNNTSGLSYAAQTTAGLSASTKGGTVIRVTSGTSPFVTSAAFPFSATLDGVAIASPKIVGSAAGNYFTGTVGPHAADSAPVLKITQNGVSKSFAWAAVGASTNTHEFSYGGSTIVTTPASGASNGGNVITVSGTGFSTTAGNDVVTVGGVSCPISGTPTATSLKCTVPAAATPFAGPVTVQVAVTGGLTSVISAGSTYTYLAE